MCCSGVAVCCSGLSLDSLLHLRECITVCCSMLQNIAVCCSMLQYVAVVLQCVAVDMPLPRSFTLAFLLLLLLFTPVTAAWGVAVCCSVLQCVAVCCSIVAVLLLQCCCSVVAVLLQCCCHLRLFALLRLPLPLLQTLGQ